MGPEEAQGLSVVVTLGGPELRPAGVSSESPRGIPC